MSKEKQIEKTKKTLTRANVPIDERTHYDPYAKELDIAVCDERIKNIAITAPYGAGKSSMVLVYNKYFKPQKEKAMYISLAAFNTQKNDDENVPTKIENDKENQVIEKSILQQFLFKVSNSKLPASRIHRIKPRSKGFFVFPLLISLILLSSFFFALNNTSLFWIKTKWLGIASSIICISSLILLIFFSAYKIRIRKFSLRNFEAELCDNSNESLFNSYIDELVYFFQKTKHTIIYIEDLDRIKDSIGLFTKLRELNFLLNNNERIKNKVTFVYCLGEDVFENTAERSKFFEKIITIIPYLNRESYKTKIKTLIEEEVGKEHLENEQVINFISDASEFLLADPRILNGIFSDYQFYSKNISTDTSFIKLFAMLTYKNLYPKDFAKLQHNGGLLVDIFRKLEELKEMRKNDYDKKIKALQTELVNASNETISSIKSLKYIFAGYISALSTSDYYTSGQPLALDIDFDKVTDTTSFRMPLLSSYCATATFAEINKQFIADEKIGFKEKAKRIQDKGIQQQESIKLSIKAQEKQKRSLIDNPMQHFYQTIQLSMKSKHYSSKIMKMNICLNNYGLLKCVLKMDISQKIILQ